MSAGGAPGGLGDLRNVLHKSWGWLLAFGIAQTVLGAIAIAAPLVGTVATALFLGWLLIVSGSFQIVHAIQGRRERGFWLHLLGGLLYVVTGWVVVMNPLGGALGLTILLAGFLIADGAARVWLGLHLRPAAGWEWVLVAGIAGAFAGMLIASQLPSSALWAIGLLVGINLVWSGSAGVAIALRVRKG